MSAEVIINSFRVCGISVNPDGFEDDLIHSIKPGQVADSAAPLIAAEMAQLASLSEVDDSEDPFLSCDELEEDEATIEDD